MTDPDIAALAKGLTQNERNAILGIYSFSSPWEEDASEAKLHQIGIWKTYRIHSGETHWTPLGILVRDYLKENGDG